ncbi:hypothetical protein G4B88_014580 [Cannabis sativa]|uniref:Uncharacterized protein n=1 Tax=Cannabis sativa TaxID=3483 RepID=A0A7J6I965_CANSA|nr:hypothetical protein G4B88_014580 [Cannabis sativa]
MAITSNLLLTDLASKAKHVPSNYVRPISDRPNLAALDTSAAHSIPLIDLQDLYGPNHSKVIQQIGQACQLDGFFQVKNHGIAEEVVETMLSIAKEFFQMPEDERLKIYSNDPTKTTRLSTSFNVNTEKVSNWRDFLRLHCHPLQDYVNEWPSNPPSFREDVAKYCTSVRGLVISNDRYKSVLHRAVVNSSMERLSVPTFYCPSLDAIMEPAKDLVNEQNPAVYRSFTYADYYQKFWDRGLNTECCLDLFKTDHHLIN